MPIQFTKATKKKAKLRLAIDGPSGSGKTFTALTAATAIAEGGKIAVIDTERGSASLYSDRFAFDVLELDTFSPGLYIDAIEAAENAGYSVIVIDSLSHAWEGEGGALDLVDKAARQSQSNNTYFAWKNVTPLQRKLVDTMLQSRCHIIATMRSKTEYIIEEVEKNGRKTSVPKKVGTAPVQRSGIEYEFTIFGDMTVDHDFMVSKTRFDRWTDTVVTKPDVHFFHQLIDWLNSGADVPPPPPPTIPSPETPSVPAVPDTSQETQTPGHDLPPLRLQPEQLKTAIADRAKTLTGQVSNGKRGLVVAILETILSQTTDPIASRHQLLKYLTGFSSSKDIPDGVILAMFRWLNPSQDSGGEWLPDPMSAREAMAAFAAAQPPQDALF